MYFKQNSFGFYWIIILQVFVQSNFENGYFLFLLLFIAWLKEEIKYVNSCREHRSSYQSSRIFLFLFRIFGLSHSFLSQLTSNLHFIWNSNSKLWSHQISFLSGKSNILMDDHLKSKILWIHSQWKFHQL